MSQLLSHAKRLMGVVAPIEDISHHFNGLFILIIGEEIMPLGNGLVESDLYGDALLDDGGSDFDCGALSAKSLLSEGVRDEAKLLRLAHIKKLLYQDLVISTRSISKWSHVPLPFAKLQENDERKLLLDMLDEVELAAESFLPASKLLDEYYGEMAEDISSSLYPSYVLTNREEFYLEILKALADKKKNVVANYLFATKHLHFGRKGIGRLDEELDQINPLISVVAQPSLSFERRIDSCRIISSYKRSKGSIEEGLMYSLLALCLIEVEKPPEEFKSSEDEGRWLMNYEGKKRKFSECIIYDYLEDDFLSVKQKGIVAEIVISLAPDFFEIIRRDKHLHPKVFNAFEEGSRGYDELVWFQFLHDWVNLWSQQNLSEGSSPLAEKILEEYNSMERQNERGDDSSPVLDKNSNRVVSTGAGYFSSPPAGEHSSTLSILRRAIIPLL